ncbi:stage III sporulation protein AC [Caldicellulosiruptor kronotskyensis 2002]|jgi:stage III sporulation protein AC|uniref:Stage III sporulation protein AC n=4 Tax=Caldicellulosiruptor TaxID=44000 RepID=E4QCN6_CALH1|nr:MULTISPECIES: stage III sporulation protein AC [Caldicellulosiruptor]ADQ07453.1 stage III sporulation protein AC [Caldicellulosiruptor hydrothermalis 108]ADQ40492.1 stage III sporulation protein AC [Caldicellulosiruptor acetigenus I77R1B]ADQ46541.1 stage III sporulation protein AC [Caldicellulosiruptor kronotskyensis 2002]AEM73073.1 stage III sporulation protein AC [Caldicellulosiruptor acetigenus 6A]WAM35405.1 stage III sporulation protein AC [Caldicellulosiruptor acetigenus]
MNGIDLIFKIAVIGIILYLVNQVLIKAEKEELAMMTTLVGVIIVLFLIIDLIRRFFDTVKSVFNLY